MRTLHCATLYKVSYSNGVREDMMKLNDLLYDACEGDWIYWNDDDPSLSCEFEISKDTFQEALKCIEDLSQEQYLSYQLNRSKDEVLRMLEPFAKDADADNDYIHFAWY